MNCCEPSGKCRNKNFSSWEALPDVPGAGQIVSSTPNEVVISSNLDGFMTIADRNCIIHPDKDFEFTATVRLDAGGGDELGVGLGTIPPYTQFPADDGIFVGYFDRLQLYGYFTNGQSVFQDYGPVSYAETTIKLVKKGKKISVYINDVLRGSVVLDNNFVNMPLHPMLFVGSDSLPATVGHMTNYCCHLI